jgi:SOS-response transcriptional repressor LexA
VYRSGNGLILRMSNPKYTPMAVGSDWRVLGVVTGKMRYTS